MTWEDRRALNRLGVVRRYRAARDKKEVPMTALTAKAALVDPATLQDGEGVIATRVPRSEIEEALETGTTSEFFLDVARERDGEREAEQHITVTWEPDDLQKLLGSTTDDEVTFTFKADELARMFDEPDVEAQGLRERMAILTVAATTAASIGAGVAAAMPANPIGESGGTGTAAAAFVTDTTSSGPAAQAGTVSNLVTDTTSSGPQASTEPGTVSNLVTDTTSSGPQGATESGFLTDATSSGPQASTESGTVSNLVTDATSSGPQASTEPGTVSNLVTDATSSGPQGATESGFLTDATSSGPQQSTEAASTGGGGSSFIESRGGQAALAGGLVLLILGAGFVGSRQRRGVQPA
jgi:hypothetical protein